ncbi:MAG: hypothetical protein PHX51_08275 [Clostridia bacterium]|nr:hypothetical protein [Clostridia bacterium]
MAESKNKELIEKEQVKLDALAAEATKLVSLTIEEKDGQPMIDKGFILFPFEKGQILKDETGKMKFIAAGAIGNSILIQAISAKIVDIIREGELSQIKNSL